MLYLQTLSLIHALVAPQLPIDFCPSATADATAVLSAGDDSDAVDTLGRGFAEAPRKCRRFVADFSIAPNAAPHRTDLSTTFALSGDAPHDSALGSEACATAKATVTVYKKAAGQAAFTKLGTHSLKGMWSHGTYCKLERASGEIPRHTPNAAGTDVYRVAVHTNFAGARASVAFTPPIQH